MNLAEFKKQFDRQTGLLKGDVQPQIEVKLMTLDDTFPIGSIELQKEGDNLVMYIQSNEPVEREVWE